MRRVLTSVLMLMACQPAPTEDELFGLGGEGPEGTSGGTCERSEGDVREPMAPPVDVSPDDREGFCLAVPVDEVSGLDVELFLQSDCLGVKVPGALRFVAGVSLFDDDTGTDYQQDFRVELPREVRGVRLPQVAEGTTLLVAKVSEFQDKRLLRLVNLASVRDVDGRRVLETRTDLAAEHMSGAMRVDGPGLYAVFAAKEPLGFVSGKVTLGGQPVPGALLTATKAPFITFADQEGAFSIASLKGQAGIVAYDPDSGATGQVFLPVQPAGEINPKTGEAAETPATEAPLPSLDALNLTGIEVKLEAAPTPEVVEPAEPVAVENLDFESGTLTPWERKGHVEVLDEDFETLFSGSKDHRYAFLTTGAGSEEGARSALIRDFEVPPGVTKMHLRYSFLSQEYPAWLDSPYNDLFVVYLAGSTEFLVKESVQGNEDDWIDYFQPVGNVTSSDAEVGDVHQVFGGRLEAREATVALKGCASGPVRVVFAVTDIGDRIYDSAAGIDAVWFE